MSKDVFDLWSVISWLDESRWKSEHINIDYEFDRIKKSGKGRN